MPCPRTRHNIVTAGNQTSDLLITSLIPLPLSHLTLTWRWTWHSVQTHTHTNVYAHAHTHIPWLGVRHEFEIWMTLELWTWTYCFKLLSTRNSADISQDLTQLKESPMTTDKPQSSEVMSWIIYQMSYYFKTLYQIKMYLYSPFYKQCHRGLHICP